MGLGTAVIQFKEISKQDINHIYTFTFYLSIAFSIIFALLSFPISFFYKNNAYRTICLILSISVFFNMLNTIPNAVLLREKRFFFVGIRLIIITIITSCITVILALKGFKYYAIVLQSVLSAFSTWLLNNLSAKLKLTKKIDFSAIKSIKDYSSYHFGFNIVNFFARNIDKLIVGKALGDIAIAQYDKAYKMMLYPIQNLTQVITPALHPILSEYQNDKEYIYNKLIKIAKWLSLTGILITAVCFWCGKEIILLVFGNQWHEAAVSFKWLSISIWVQMVTGCAGSIFQSLGKTKHLFQVTLINTTISLTAIILGVVSQRLWILSLLISLCYIMHFFFAFLFLISFSFKKNFISFFSNFVPEVIIILIIFIILYFFSTFVKTELLLFSFLIKGSVITAIYLLLLIMLNQIRFLKFK
jgi:PST family polysaccharide transporter